MGASKSHIPEGHHSVTPYLCIRGAVEAIAFYTKAFGAQEITKNLAPDGKRLWHARIRIGDSIVMMSDEFPESGGITSSPPALEGTTAMIHLYVPNADEAVKKAGSAGATVIMEPQDMFWGERFGMVKDPFGHVWSISHTIEVMKQEETRDRAGKEYQ